MYRSLLLINVYPNTHQHCYTYPHTKHNAYTNAHKNTYANTHQHADHNAHTNAHGNAHANGYRYYLDPQPDTNGHLHPVVDANAIGYSDDYRDSHTHSAWSARVPTTDPERHHTASPDPDGHTHIDPIAHSHGNTDGHSHANSDPDTNTHTDTHDDAHHSPLPRLGIRGAAGRHFLRARNEQ